MDEQKLRETINSSGMTPKLSVLDKKLKEAWAANKETGLAFVLDEDDEKGLELAESLKNSLSEALKALYRFEDAIISISEETLK